MDALFIGMVEDVKMAKKIFFLFLLLTMIAPAAAQDAPGTDEMPWWNDRVFYEIFVRSFQDSDGDGNGDLQGIISKLDYLNDGDPNTDTDLGITGIWLMPIMQSPTYHGYDVIDYMTIEEDYGTNEDFRQLIEEAHERGIAVIVDLMLNHTSREHPWFADAIQPGSAHDSWYRWSATNPGYSGPWGQPVWHQAGGRYFYGVFWDGMPDLNLRNPAVTQAVYDVADFWLTDMGVDGFRLDAIKHLIEVDRQQESTEPTFAWLEDWNDHIDSVKPDALTVGEVFGGSGNVMKLYVPDGVDTTFEFGLADAMLRSANTSTARNIIGVQNQVLDIYPPGQYSTFLTNHDQNRVMNFLGGDIDKAKVTASLLLTSPGVPFLYYGEEIGMIGMKPDECIRTPMQWEAEIEIPAFMQGKNCFTNEGVNNLAGQVDDPDSLFNHYRALIHFRNAHPALRVGSYTSVESSDGRLYSFIRQTAYENLLVIINLSNQTVTDYTLALSESSVEAIAAGVMLGTGDAKAPELNESGGFSGYTPLDTVEPSSVTIITLN